MLIESHHQTRAPDQGSRYWEIPKQLTLVAHTFCEGSLIHLIGERSHIE